MDGDGCEVDLSVNLLNCGACHPNQLGDPNSQSNHPGAPACTGWNQTCTGGTCQ